MNLESFAHTGRLALAMLGVVAGLAVAAPAFAQEDEITVTPPYVVHRERDRRAGGVAPVEVVRVSRTVTTAGLDLRYDSDIDELHRRVVYTAQEVCDVAGDILRTVSTTSDRECVREAVRGAMPQFRDVVARARL